MKSLCENLAKNISQCLRTDKYVADQEIVSQKFAECILYQHLQEHKDFISPIVSECLKKISDYRIEIEKSKEIIKRFDEVILEKASKFSVDTLIEKLKTFINKDDYNIIDRKFQNEKRNISKIVEELKEELKNAKSE